MPKPTAAIVLVDRGPRLLHRLDDRRHQARLVEPERLPPDAVADGEIGPDDAREELRAAEVDPDDAARLARAAGMGAATIPTPMADEKRSVASRARRKARLQGLPQPPAAAAPARATATDAARRAARARTRRQRPDYEVQRTGRRGPRLPTLPRARAARARRAAPPRSRPAASSSGSLLALVGWVAALRRAVHGLRPDPARRPGRRGRPAARRRPVPADRREHDPRARLRRAHRGPRRARLRRPEPLGLDHAAADRRRRQRVALDPARHGRRHPRPRDATRSTPPTRSAARRSPPRPSRSSSAIEINHVVEVSFENFPQLIDALGGVTYKGGCVLSKINGGTQQRRQHAAAAARARRRSTATQALALARTRKNLRNPSENDLDARAPPAAARRGDEGQGHVVRDVHPAAVGLVGGAEGGALRHGRPDAARRRRAPRCTGGDEQAAGAQAVRRRDAARRRRRPDRRRRDEAGAPSRASCAAERARHRRPRDALP